MKKITLLLGVLGLSMTMAAQTATKITFEDATIGTTGGTTVGWGGTVDVMANPVTTGNASTKVLHANSINYMPIYFGNVALPAGAETLYSTIRFKILVVGGSDVNYPTFNIFSSPDAWVFGNTPAPYKIAAIGSANLWGTAEIGVWKTVEFALSSSLLIPIPEGHLVLNLSKGSSATANCEYLIDDVELVPSVAPAPVITLTDFESNTIGEVLNMKRYNLTDATATVEANPTDATNKSVHIVTSNYDALLKLNVTLPSGKVFSNYNKLSFDIYLKAGFDNNYKKVQLYVESTKIYEDASYPSQAPDATWTTKEYAIDLTNFTSLASLNAFVLDLGISTNNGNYYIDNVKLTEASTGLNQPDAKQLPVRFLGNTIELGKLVNQAEVFDVNGRLLISSKNTSSINASTLNQGIYIVKANVDGQNYISKVVK